MLFLLVLSVGSNAQVKELNYAELEPYLHKQNDTCYVINFWATWCAPCVAELPYFELLNERYKLQPVKVILVSLDFPRHKESRLLPFIDKHQLKSEVFFLNDPNANEWINSIDPEWSGAIPYTLIYKKKQRFYYEQSFTYEELEKAVQLALPQKETN